MEQIRILICSNLGTERLMLRCVKKSRRFYRSNLMESGVNTRKLSGLTLSMFGCKEYCVLACSGRQTVYYKIEMVYFERGILILHLSVCKLKNLLNF